MAKIYEIDTLLLFFPKIFNIDKNDIFNFPKNSSV